MLLLRYLQLRAKFSWSLSNLAALPRQQLFVQRDMVDVAGRTVPTAAGAARDGDEAVGATVGGTGLIGTAGGQVAKEKPYGRAFAKSQLGQQQRSDPDPRGVLQRPTWFSEGA